MHLHFCFGRGIVGGGGGGGRIGSFGGGLWFGSSDSHCDGVVVVDGVSAQQMGVGGLR